jgi:Acyclic terpene utilisation family protein AtuA
MEVVTSCLSTAPEGRAILIEHITSSYRPDAKPPEGCQVRRVWKRKDKWFDQQNGVWYLNSAEGVLTEHMCRPRSSMASGAVRTGPAEARRVRIGCGAGFAGDRIDPARDLAERGELDFLFFECLAERTLAQSQLARLRNPEGGYNPFLERRLDAVLPGCSANGTRIVTNSGAANPHGAGLAAAEAVRRAGLTGVQIAVVDGDDVSHLLGADTALLEGGTVGDLGRKIICANAYLGADVIADALDEGADIVITGRVTDPALVLGPLLHVYGWSRTDWRRIGAGTLVGHLLECSAQVTGGYFADPGRKDVKNLAFVGYPYAEVAEDGSATIRKLDGTGGCVTRATVIEQLFYELHDPSAYVTPDVVADFSQVQIEESALDSVEVSGANGSARPEHYKVTIGFDGGYLAESDIGYSGAGAARRALLAGDILRERMAKLYKVNDLRVDLIGLSSNHGTARPDDIFGDSRDVRMRAALRTWDKNIAETLLMEVETLWIAGPAGGAGVRGRILPSIETRSALIPRESVTPQLRMITV